MSNFPPLRPALFPLPREDSSGRSISRRSLVTALAVAAPFIATPRRTWALPSATRALRLSHLHTGEQLTVEYFSGGAYVPDAMSAINRLLRDFRTGEVFTIDAQLLDLLAGLAELTGTTQPYQVISGYRSPSTNQTLRKRSKGVAVGSLHLKGRAIDIRLADVALDRLREAACTLRCGGVGYYPGSDFVHVDTGRVRTW
ncbi:MAG: DUF882 domain-containing protein [Burkholderiaceae bacterium]|nr:DUF882 domain-containing protein [Burkholderiaceae bacterium]MDH3459996.1 DUF882 domain-containing protein [Burkholderiaceae bacterium]